MDLENEVQCARNAMMALTDGDLAWFNACQHFVKLLHSHFAQAPNLCMLDEVIDVQERILNARSSRVEEVNGIALLAEAHHTLADSLMDHIDYTGKDTVSSRAVELCREALRLCSIANSNQLLANIKLSRALVVRYCLAGDSSALEEAVAVARKAIDNSERGDQGFTWARDQYARTLTLLFKRNSDENLLEQIVSLDRLILLLANDSESQARACANLSESLFLYSDPLSNHAFLDEAVALQRQALELGIDDQLDYGSALAHLCALLRMQFRQNHDTNVLEESIKVAREALSVIPPNCQPRSTACGQLANSLTSYFYQSADDDSLSEAIGLRREALETFPLQHHDRVFAELSLAHVLSLHYQCTEDDSILREASSIVDNIAKRSEDAQMESSQQAHVSALRATLFNLWFERTGDQRFLHDAIRLVQSAITLRPEDHFDHATWMAELALYTTTLYDQEGASDSDMLDLIISTELNVLAQHPQGSIKYPQSCTNLAASLLVRFDARKDSEDVEDALQLCHMALIHADPMQAWRSWTIIAHAHLKLDTRYFDIEAALGALGRALVPTIRIVTPLIHATLRLLNQIWTYIGTSPVPEALAPVYKLLINMLPLQANPEADKAIQLRTLWQCNAVGSEALVAAVRSGSPLDGLGMLESAHAILWSQRRRHFPVDIARELVSTHHQLATSGAHSGSSIQTGYLNRSGDSLSEDDPVASLKAQAELLLQQIREYPGFESYLFSISPHMLLAAAADHPVVIIVSARGSCYALILRPHNDEAQVISLDFDPDSYKPPNSQTQPRGTIHDEGNTESEDFASRGMTVKAGRQASPFERQLATLWHKIVKPVLDHLGFLRICDATKPRIYWCPTGKLSFLPLHAAGVYQGAEKEQVRCSDYVVSSYAPSVTSILRAREHQSPLSREQLRILLIAEKRAMEDELPTISGVDEEIIQIQKLTKDVLEVDVLGGAEQPGGALLDHVSSRMQQTNVVHLACHGIQAYDPLDSGFCLSDGRLTVRKLMDLELPNAFLAFCSACETGKGDEYQPDQGVHLASAMLHAGFTNVIATMWSVHDVDGPKIARYVYEDLLAHSTIDSDVVARVLDRAIGKLRASGVSPERWAPFIHVGA